MPVMAVLVLLGLTAWFASFSQIKVYASETASGQQAGGFLLPGEGTAGDPWLIESLEDLEEVRETVDAGENCSGKYFRLTTDLQLPEDWPGLGSLKKGTTGTGYGKNIQPFSGNFDGDGHKVTAADGGYPLFAYVREAVIRNLRIGGHQINGNGLIRWYVIDRGDSGIFGIKTATVENVTICSGTSTLGSGIVSGYAAAGNQVNIIGCTVEEGVTIGYTGTQSKIGSFGGDYNGIIRDCTSAATVRGVSYVGGIIGCRGNSMSENGVYNCAFSGQVIASGQYAGGIAGGSYGGTGHGIDTAPNAPMQKIRNCLCTGTVEAADIAGGIEGYETTVQVWDDGYLTGNLFTGQVACSEGTYTGGIIGKLRGIDRCNIIKDNYYRSGCGADRGIGGVQYVDTSYADHETRYGEVYFNTGEEIPIIPGINDVYAHNLRPDYNRKDDPLGKGASALAKEVSDTQLTDGTVTAWLNQAPGSLKNWTQGEAGPQNRMDPMITGIRIKPGYTEEYTVGSSLDIDSMELVLAWSDGRETSVGGDDKDLVISGYDSSKQAVLDLTASYTYKIKDGQYDEDASDHTVAVTFPVRILVPDDGSSKKVAFTLLGDRAHGPDADCGIHSRVKNNLEEWIIRKEYEAGPNDTARDLILRALEETGLGYKDAGDRRYGGYCITGVQIPGMEELLSQFTNGERARWLYAVGGENMSMDADRYFLRAGDELILFYTDDYQLEEKEEPDPPVPDKDDSAPASKKVVKGKSYTLSGNTYKVTRTANAKSPGTVTLVKAKNAGKIQVPATVKLADGRTYKVTVVGKKAFRDRKIRKVIIGKNVKKLAAYAFAKSGCRTVILKTKLLKKASVKKCLKSSKVRKILVRAGNARTNRRVKKKYKKIFTRKNTGRKIKI